MSIVAESYYSNSFCALKVDISSTGSIKFTVPIFDTTQTTTEADCQVPCYTITKTADSNKIKYAPAEVTDNLLSITCYVTKDISVSGDKHYYQVNA